MRNLQNPDVFAIGRILKKANLKDEIKQISFSTEDYEALGFELLFTIFTNCSSKEVEEEIYDLLSSLFEMDKDDVKKLNPFETFEMLKQVDDWEKWKSFFSLGAKSMK